MYDQELYEIASHVVNTLVERSPEIDHPLYLTQSYTTTSVLYGNEVIWDSDEINDADGDHTKENALTYAEATLRIMYNQIGSLLGETDRKK